MSLVQANAERLGEIEALKEGIVAILASPPFLILNQNDLTPQERFAATDKDFIGRDALLARSPRSRIALLALEGEDTDALIGEAIFHGDHRVGSVTSAAYGQAVGRSLAIAFLTDGVRDPGTLLQVSLLGRRVPAVVLPDAPWDPQNKRLKS